MSAEENLALVRELLEAMRRHDVDQAVSYYVDDCVVDIAPMRSLVQGRGNLGRTWRMAWTAFPDQYYTERNMFAGGDYVLFEGVMGGTQKGTYMNIPSTGKHIAFPVAFIWRVVDGKVMEWHTYWDAADLLRQVDVIPESTKLPLGES